MSTIKNDNEINFLATTDINAVENFLVGFKFIYEELIKALSKEGLKEISAIAKQLATNNNRGVVVSGDLTGYIRYTGNILSYTTMTAPIANHLLAGFGNHDALY